MAQPSRAGGLRAADLSGLQKAAILVMYLEDKVARQVLDQLSLDELEDIGIAMSEVENVAVEVIEEVMA